MFSFRLSFSKEQYSDLLFLLVVSSVFLCLSLYQIELPGLYGDELDKLVPTVGLLTGQPFPLLGWCETVFGTRILLTFTDRIGPVLSYLPMPFILLFGYTPFALRLSSVICGWLTLVFAYFGAKIWFGPWVARYGIALTAVSPFFIFLQRMGYYNYGPVTLFTSVSFFFLARYISNRNTRTLWAGAVFAGIAIETALQAVFVLFPIGLLAILFFDKIRPRLREIIIALGIVLIISSPLLIMVLKTGSVSSRLGWSGPDSGGLTLSTFIETLSVHVPLFTVFLGGVDGVHEPITGNDIRNVYMSYAFWLSIPVLAIFFLLSQDKKDYIRRNAAPLLITLFGLFLTGFITNVNGRINYQLIYLWPFAMLAVGAGLALFHERFRRLRLVTIALACVLIIIQAHVTIQSHQRLSQSRGGGYTSSQIYSLVYYLEERPDLHPIPMDWGLLNQIYFLTGGKILPEAIHGWWQKDGTPPEEFNVTVAKHLQNPSNVYIFLAPGKGMFDRYPHFERLAKNANNTLRLERVFYERDGSIAYRLFRALNSVNANSLKILCVESVPSGRWKGEYFNNKTLSGSPMMVRDEGERFISFDWSGGSPDVRCGNSSDNFSARWTRILHFDEATYRFTITSNDGFRFFVDGQLKLDKWFDQPPTTYTVDVPLSAKKHIIKLEYYQSQGEAIVSLSWHKKNLIKYGRGKE